MLSLEFKECASYFSQIDGNKEKERISKRVFQENKAPQICGALFSWNTRFEIQPFTLLPTK